MKRRRGKVYFHINSTYARPAVRDMIDHDYLDKLSESELQWLDNFNKAYYAANCKDSKLFPTTEERRALFNMNNERRRDLYNNRTRYRLYEEMNDAATKVGINTVEDRLIAKIDGQEETPVIPFENFDIPEHLRAEFEQTIAPIVQKIRTNYYCSKVIEQDQKEYADLAAGLTEEELDARAEESDRDQATLKEFAKKLRAKR